MITQALKYIEFNILGIVITISGIAVTLLISHDIKIESRKSRL